MPSPKSKPKPRLNSAGTLPPQLSFEAIGTHWAIDIYEPVEAGRLAGLESAVRRRIEQFDRDYSRFRDDSLISSMAGAAGTYQLPEDAQPLFDLYRELYEITGGQVTPLIGRLLSDAGYDRDYSLHPDTLRPVPAWDDVLLYEFPLLTLKAPAIIDLGAAGKGYLVDLIAKLLDDHGVASYCVDAGGDMTYRGPAGRPLEVGLEHPEDLSQVIGIVRLSNQSLCGSSGNRRAWAGYHHIMNPTTKTSPTHLRAVWVVADTTLLADALTTALFFVPASTLARAFDFQYVILGEDYSLQHSPDITAEFFTAEA